MPLTIRASKTGRTFLIDSSISTTEAPELRRMHVLSIRTTDNNSLQVKATYETHRLEYAPAGLTGMIAMFRQYLHHVESGVVSNEFGLTPGETRDMINTIDKRMQTARKQKQTNRVKVLSNLDGDVEFSKFAAPTGAEQ